MDLDTCHFEASVVAQCPPCFLAEIFLHQEGSVLCLFRDRNAYSSATHHLYYCIITIFHNLDIEAGRNFTQNSSKGLCINSHNFSRRNVSVARFRLPSIGRHIQNRPIQSCPSELHRCCASQVSAVDTAYQVCDLPTSRDFGEHIDGILSYVGVAFAVENEVVGCY